MKRTRGLRSRRSGFGVLALTGFAMAACSVATAWQNYVGSTRERLTDQYERHYADQWVPIDTMKVAQLAPGDSTNFSLPLEEGQPIGVLGACYGRCDDLDITVIDPNGFTADRAPQIEGETEYPFSEFETHFGGDYRISVRMVACHASECFFAVWPMRGRN